MTDLLPVTRIPRTGLPPRAVVVGDPFRAERMAKRLDDPVEVAWAREYRTFRGSWQGVEVVVSSHGVGGPGAICLFQELTDAGIGTILRLGTAGAMQAGIADGDLIIAEGCVRDDGVTQQLVPPEYPAVCSPETVLALTEAAREREAPHHRGLVWTRAAFYPGLLPVPMPAYVHAGVLAIEMELSALLVHGSLNGVTSGGVLVIDGVAADELVGSTGYDPHREVVAAGVERGMDVALDALVRADVTEADLLVTGGTVLTVDDPGTIVRDGAVAVRDGVIVAVGPSAEVAEEFTAAETLDATGSLVMPGLVNTHAHLAMNLFRGEADDVSLEEFLERLLAAELALLDAAAVAVGVEAALAESLRGGVTTALDMYWFPEAASEVADRVGFRLLNGPSFMDVIDPEGRDFDARMAWAEKLLTTRRDADPDAPAWVMPHSAYMLSRDQLEQIMDLAARFGARVHVHAAESPGEDDAVRARHDDRPLPALGAAGVLGPGTVVAHAVQLDDADIALLAATGAAVAHCPVSNLNLGCGVAPLPALLRAGVPVGIGTDGAVSAGALDMFAGIRMAALLHKGVTRDPRTVGAERAVRLATAGGAAVVGLRDRIGSLTVGRRADLIVCDLDRPHVAPNADPWSAVAYGLTAADVLHTVVEGRVLMRDRALTTIDERSVLDRITGLRRARAAGEEHT